MKKLLIPALLCLSTLVFAQNLLTEECSGFECDSLPGNTKVLWGNRDHVQITDEESYRGQKSLKAAFGDKVLRVFIHTPELEFKEGETYTVSAFVKTSGANINVGFFCCSYIKLWNEGSKTHKFEPRPVTTDWRQIKMTAKLKTDGKLLGVLFLGKPGEVIYIDEVKVEKGDKASWSEPEKKSLATSYRIDDPQRIAFDPAFGEKFAKGDWSQTDTVDKFVRVQGDEKEKPQKTALQLASDGKYLYARFVCEEQNLSAMKSSSVPNLPNWDDDRVELHINFSGMKLRNDIKYFSVNSEGVYVTNFPGDEKTFSVRKKKGDGKWEVSYRLPLTCFGFEAVPGMCWRLSAGRFHRTQRKETSAFAKTKFHFNRDSAAFLNFILSGEKNGFPPVVLADLGEVTDSDNHTGGNALSFLILGKQPASDLKILVNGKAAKIYSSGQNLTAYYTLSGIPSEKLAFEVKDKNDRTLLRGSCDAKLFRDTERAYRTKGPFVFEELFGKKRERERFHITWGMVVDRRNFADALKTGVPYSREKVFRDLKDSGIRLLERDAMDVCYKVPNIRKGNFPAPKQDPDMSRIAGLMKRGLMLPVCYYSYSFIPGVDENGKLGLTAGSTGFFGLLTDPINEKAYLQTVDKVMDTYGKEIGIFFLGDEVTPLNIYRGRQMNQPFNDKESLEKWNNDVKTQEGDGRFGIPWGMKENDPLYPPSDRAFRAYMADKIAGVAEKAAKIAREKKKDIIILSDDAYGVPSTHGVQHWSRYADCGSFQLGEGGIISRKDWPALMFNAKMVKDIGMVKDLVVVTHEAVSGYPTGAMGQAEMLECYSQVIRGGATGFHFWAASMGQRYEWDGQPASIVIGYPTGYQFMLAMSKTLTKVPELKFPETETAFLVSDDSLMFSKKGYDAFRRGFIVIGEQLGGWFKFVSDTHLRRGEESLSKYKIVYVPYASYLRKETLTMLEDFVKNGGTAICGDPLLAAHNIHGDKVEWLRSSFGGIRWNECGSENRKLESGIPVEAVRSFPADPSAKVLEKYDNGEAAIIEKTFGKGKLILCGFQLFPATSGKLDGMIAKLHKANGGNVGQKIWNFKLPAPNIPNFQPKEGRCLTGNYGYWDRHRFFAGTFQNDPVSWNVSITRNGKTETAGLKKSKLFDRLSYFKRQKDFKKGATATWVEEFSAGTHSIVIQTDKNTDISELVMYFAGDCTAFSVETSQDGKIWKKASSAELSAGELEVKRLSVPLAGELSRIRIKFDVPQGKTFTVAEAEVWTASK